MSPTNLGLTKLIRKLFDLFPDTDEAGTVESIRKNVEFRSGNAWTLVFAIFIASIGLNTNSAAVIIGAMLISPLMGPIVGAGLALGTYDFALLKRSIRNLGIAVVISVATSSFYFLLSPLGDAQSELLARTRPTVFDVLIAVFGGATGIVAASRKEKGNAVPGVAIATALMPPLCTAGYGLASRQFSYFFGALYLFSINSVFICLATYVFVRYLRFATTQSIDLRQKAHLKKLVTLVAVVTMVPSVALAWYYVQEARFKSEAAAFLRREFAIPGTHVIGHEIKYSLQHPQLTVSLIGNQLPASTIEQIREKMRQYRLRNAVLSVSQSTIEEDLERRLSERLSSKLSQQPAAESPEKRELEILRAQLLSVQQQSALSDQIRSELAIAMPEVSTFHLVYLSATNPQPVALIKLARGGAAKTAKLRKYLKTRLNRQDVTIYQIR